ncbi:receptor protein-tyrosine kinase CEPR1-like [Diospyros lotus]|uniref:receptor protein-tyrosine kinase CEPR1-like n=1 Tax=Diospyros lotus TaxID=55363 RepID=UPI00225168C3|nr:receptor protein-tyrosine kinase CEPR1-like [Diospyros lotus]
MAFDCIFLLVLLLLSPLNCFPVAGISKQSQFFTLLKSSLQGKPLSDLEAKPFCNFTGIGCNAQGHVVSIDFSGWSLSGSFPEDVCSYLPELRVLRLGHNHLRGGFPYSITNCSLLQELNFSSTSLSGPLPDFSPMVSLRSLDLSANPFSGDFPISVLTNLTNLEQVYFYENRKFNSWKLPENISRLGTLKSMVLTTCSLHGSIPASIGNMTSLTDLELSENLLVGRIPSEIGRLKNLQQLELYKNQLEGELPEELGNLTELEDLDMSVNKFTGKIPDSICRLPKLKVLQLYNNSLDGKIPESIESSTTLTMLSLYDNMLTGEVPARLGASSPMILFEISENELSGQLPAEVCNGGKLLYFLVLGNMFSGKVPESYSRCQSLLRFRVSSNYLEGPIPEGLFSLPHASIVDLADNILTGTIPKRVGNAQNLSELFLQSNRISGVLPEEISEATNLVKIDLSNNLLSGPIPSEIGTLKKLNQLMLQGNKFNSSIPDSLSSLISLNVLDLSNNLLGGKIPESLCDLLPNSMNFSYNLLSGPIPLSFINGGILLESFHGNPGLCVPQYPNNYSSDLNNFPICSDHNRKKIQNCIWAFGISAGIIVLGTVLFIKRWFARQHSMAETDETFSSSFFSCEVKSFHGITFDQREVVESMVEKNVVGHGGSGTVYRIQLRTGEVFAVKKLWSPKTKDSPTTKNHDQLSLDKELRTEVETLGNVRHKNIVKLYSCLSFHDFSLLVYEYMANGNLWDALHRGKMVLDWPTRHQIALGVAQGLAYLHHDLKPAIIHRDIKSTNILLDIDYQPKVADFGIAKALQGRGKDCTITVIGGTCGYFPPEYAYSCKATTKCDVYSFGVVLMELITGRKPVEVEFGENKNIIYWVSSKLETEEGIMEVLDRRVSGSFKDEMIRVLQVAVRCTFRMPANRPSMAEVVQCLIDADPCGIIVQSCMASNKPKTRTGKCSDHDSAESTDV